MNALLFVLLFLVGAAAVGVLVQLPPEPPAVQPSSRPASGPGVPSRPDQSHPFWCASRYASMRLPTPSLLIASDR